MPSPPQRNSSLAPVRPIPAAADCLPLRGRCLRSRRMRVWEQLQCIVATAYLPPHLVGADDSVRPLFPVSSARKETLFEPILFFLCQKEKNGFNLPRKERGQGANRCPEFDSENFDLYLSVASNPTIRKDSALCASPFGGAAQQDQRLRADEGIGPYRAQCQIKRADRVVRPYKRCGGNRKRGPMKALAPTGCGAKSKRRATNGRPLRLGSECDRDRRGGYCPPEAFPQGKASAAAETGR